VRAMLASLGASVSLSGCRLPSGSLAASGV